MPEKFKKYIAEFIGTFFLMLPIIAMVNKSNTVSAPFAFPAVLMGMIYALGHVSRAHFNPLISLGFIFRKQLKRRDFLGYFLAQLCGALCAIWVAHSIFELAPLETSIQLGQGDYSVLKGFFAEFFGMFAIYLVVMITATTKRLAGNSFYGIAIAFTVMGVAFCFGSYGTLAAFNPAVSIGFLFAGNTTVFTASVAIAGQVAGALTAALAFKMCYTPIDEEDA